MNDKKEALKSKLIDISSNTGVAHEKIKDAQRLLGHMTGEFFEMYDPKDERGIMWIAHSFEHHAAFARILDVCLDEVYSMLVDIETSLEDMRLGLMKEAAETPHMAGGGANG